MRSHRVLMGLLSLVLAAVLWLPNLHRLLREPESRYRSATGIPPLAREVAARHIQVWTDPATRQEAIGRMRGRNAEWDFMARTFFVAALANMALRDETFKSTALPIVDSIIRETITLEQQHGMRFFLMSYASHAPFKQQPERSQFIDGEIALMIALRRLVEDTDEMKALLTHRVDLMADRMRASPSLNAESYPDECWLFCNTIALAAIKIADVLDGSDHSGLINGWLGFAKAHLIEPKTGILLSSYSLDGTIPMDGPEGSSIWLAVHCLQIIDPDFARDQYELARKHLAQFFGGFGYAYEWPALAKGMEDVDSGPILPIIDLSAGSTGLAFIGAASFDDRDYLRGLFSSLNLGGFPKREAQGIRYCSSNTVGDAVMLYAMTLGPAWEEVRKREKKP